MAAYFNVEGQSITFYEWAQLLVDEEYSRVAYTEIDGRLHDSEQHTRIAVSTKWLGLNMGIYDGPLQIFETAVFAAADPDVKLWIQRYPNRESSRAGHARCVWCIYQGLDPLSEVPSNATCITCQQRPVTQRFKVGSWLCLECEVLVTAGDLLHPVARIAV